MKIVCPSCNAVYSIDGSKINFNIRKPARCVKCKSRFFIEKLVWRKKKDKKSTNITFLKSYFEKRRVTDRREGIDRRKKIEKEVMPFMSLSKDFMPIFNSEGDSIGYFSPGRREGRDRRTILDRRRYLAN